MTVNLLSSEKEFEDYCLGAFKSMLHGEMFPYSLRGTYHLVFNSWDEAVNELQENGVEGYSYQEKPEDDDYFLSLHGFTQHVVMQDKTLELLACFCNTTYRQQMALFDIPVRFNTRCEKKENGLCQRDLINTMKDSHPAVVTCMPRLALTSSCRSQVFQWAPRQLPLLMVCQKKDCCVH